MGGLFHGVVVVGGLVQGVVLEGGQLAVVGGFFLAGVGVAEIVPAELKPQNGTEELKEGSD